MKPTLTYILVSVLRSIRITDNMIIMAMVIGGLLLVTIALLIAVLVMCCRNRAYALTTGSMKSYKVRRSDVSNINYINEQTVVLNRSQEEKPKMTHHDESSSVVNPETTTTYHYSSSRSKNSSSLYPNSTSRFDSFLSRNDSSALESTRVPPTRFESTGILQNGQKRISNGSSRGSRASRGSRGMVRNSSRSSNWALRSFLPFGGHSNELGRLPSASDESPIAPHRRLMTSEWAHVDEVIDARRTPKLTRLSNISKMSHLQSPHVTRNVRDTRNVSIPQNAIVNGNRPKLSSQSFNPNSRQLSQKQYGDHVTQNDPVSRFGQRKLRGQQSLNPNAYRSIQFNNFGPITDVQISPSQYASVNISDRLPSLPLPLDQCQPAPKMTHQPLTHHSPMMQPIIDDEGSRHSYHSLFIPHSEQSTVV